LRCRRVLSNTHYELNGAERKGCENEDASPPSFLSRRGRAGTGGTGNRGTKNGSAVTEGTVSLQERMAGMQGSGLRGRGLKIRGIVGGGFGVVIDPEGRLERGFVVIFSRGDGVCDEGSRGGALDLALSLMKTEI